MSHPVQRPRWSRDCGIIRYRHGWVGFAMANGQWPMENGKAPHPRPTEEDALLASQRSTRFNATVMSADPTALKTLRGGFTRNRHTLVLGICLATLAGVWAVWPGIRPTILLPIAIFGIGLLEDSANLPDPDVLAREIAEDLEAALEQFATIAEDLKR